MEGSRPAWDAWIEMNSTKTHRQEDSCRVPHGTRGLKSAGIVPYIGMRLRSRPAWDAWIEISLKRIDRIIARVASRMGRVD